MIYSPGQRVVCVDSEPHTRYMPTGLIAVTELDGLSQGTVYTIAEVGDFFGLVSLVLAELTRPVRDWVPNKCPGFDARRFRPVLQVSDFMPAAERVPA